MALEFDVEMTCGSCVKKIEEAFKDKQGVKSLDINLASGQVVIESSLGIEKVKDIIESTGKRAVLKGMGGTKEHLGAAVSTMETGSQWVKGLIRFVQTEPDKLVIDGTIDGLSPGRHALCVHEYGDVSEGCTSCGDVFGYTSPGKVAQGELGDIEAGADGRAEFRFINNRIKVWEMIGRSMVVHEASTELVQQKNKNTTDKRVTCGIVARSAGLFQNPKKVCACDGVTQWDERNVPVAGKGRQANL